MNTTLKFFMILVFFSCPSFTNAQGWETVFPPDSIFDAPGLTLGLEVYPAQDGGYLFAGEIDMPTGAIRHHIRLFKTDANGTQEWGHTYNLGEIEDAHVAFLQELPDSNIIVGGMKNNFPFFFKTTPDGEILTETIFQNDTVHFVFSGMMTADGHILLTGKKSFTGELFALKWAINGDVLWIRYHDIPTFNNPYAIDETLNGDLIIAGIDGQVASLIKLDSLGNFAWKNTYFLSGDSDAVSVKATLDNGFIVGGSTEGIPTLVPWIFKTDSLGNGEWITILSDGIFGKASDIAIKTDSTFLVTGAIFSFWSFTPTGFLVHLDADGAIISQNDFTPDNQQFADIDLTADHGIILGGAAPNGMLLKKIGETITSQKNIFPKTEIKIFPHPFQNQTTFKIEKPKSQTIHLQVFDLTGKLVREEIHTSSEFIFYSKNLTNGLYFYKIKKENSLIAHGKLLIQK